MSSESTTAIVWESFDLVQRELKSFTKTELLRAQNASNNEQ